MRSFRKSHRQISSVEKFATKNENRVIVAPATESFVNNDYANAQRRQSGLKSGGRGSG